MNNRVVDIENLQVSVKGKTKTERIVHGLSLFIEAGECVGLVGESGSGKSVTSRTLLGLTDAALAVNADRFSLFDEDYLNATEKQWQSIRGRRIGYVLQDALGSLDPLKPISSEVRETLDAHRLGSKAQRQQQVLAALHDVGFPDAALRAQQRSFELSGGLRQRALIASAIVASPQLLIADEPTTALDVTVQATVLQLLQELKQSGMAMLLVSHDLGVVSTLADRIMVMHNGQVVESGKTADVLNNPSHEYTKMLLAALPAQAKRGTRIGVQQPSRLSWAQPRDAHDDGVISLSDVAPVLVVDRVSKSFALPDRSKALVVSDISFSLEQGDVLGLVGSSGSGKSTTAKLCMGLTTPDTGTIRLFNKPWSVLPEHQKTGLRRDVQLISQDPLGAFDPRFSTWQLLQEALIIGGVSDDRQQHIRAVELLDAVGMASDNLQKMPRQLSGGQRQRVAIARALATNPKLLICDEPVSALDVSIQAQVLDLLTDLQSQLGLSVLFISHDLSVVRHFCNKVMVMHEGEIIERGEAELMFDTPRHAYTQTLLASIPRVFGAPSHSQSSLSI